MKLAPDQIKELLKLEQAIVDAEQQIEGTKELLKEQKAIADKAVFNLREYVRGLSQTKMEFIGGKESDDAHRN